MYLALPTLYHCQVTSRCWLHTCAITSQFTLFCSRGLCLTSDSIFRYYFLLPYCANNLIDSVGYRYINVLRFDVLTNGVWLIVSCRFAWIWLSRVPGSHGDGTEYWVQHAASQVCIACVNQPFVSWSNNRAQWRAYRQHVPCCQQATHWPAARLSATPCRSSHCLCVGPVSEQ